MNTKTHDIFELSCPWDNPFQGNFKRALFVCSAGLLRSATGASVANKHFHMNTRNCGSEYYALIPISVNLIHWANVIFFVNEDNFNSALRTFDLDTEILDQLRDKSVIWDIPDQYDYNHPELVKIITSELDKYINKN